jgi:MFS family permease
LQYGTAGMAILSFVSGWAIDKLGATRTMAIGYVLAVAACLLGFNPVAAASVMHGWGVQLSAVAVLRSAFVLNMMANTAIYMAGLIFVTSGVHRKDVAKFCACNGAMNLFLQATIMTGAGWMMTHIFHDNYGFSFLAGISLVTIGVPLFFILDGMRRADAKNETEENTQPAATESVS